MRRIFTSIILTMLLLSNITFANPQQVELNESYSVEQTRAAANSHFTDDVDFYATMQRGEDPNDYVRRYFTANLEDWIFCVDQNEQGYICAVSMIVPDSTNSMALSTIGDVLLTIAIGADSENYSWSSKEMYLIWKARNNAMKDGHGIFYCEDTQRFYRLVVNHDMMNSRWYLWVKAYVD